MRQFESGLSGKFVVPLVAVAWASAVAAGFHRVATYEATPGPSARAPESWPAGSATTRVPGVPNVLMAVHPKCPCTRGSLSALAEVLRRLDGRVSVRLLMYRPEGSAVGWDESPSVEPDRMPGVELVDDPGGSEAARFGLATSGASVAFDAGGRRRFAGGLNARRGGDEASDGGLALLAVLGGRPPLISAAETYGCPLLREPGEARR